MARRPRKRRSPPRWNRRRTRRMGFWGIVLLIALAALLDRLGVFGYRGDDWAAFDQQTFVVARVIDGDTVEIEPLPGGQRTRVRLIGIDAPELNSRSAEPPEHWAAESSHYLRQRAEGMQVIVQLEQTRTRDRYGRLLAYLHLNTRENLNLAMVRDGHAYSDRRFRHSLRPQFDMAEHEARRRQRGLWKDVTEDQMPAWRQRWLNEQGAEAARPGFAFAAAACL